MTIRRAGAAAVLCVLALSGLFSGSGLASNDPLFRQQWGLHRIQAEAAWGPAAGGGGVVVAVVDTGVNFSHRDLAGKSAGELNAIAHRRASGCDDTPGDNNGHGTEVAGIVAASSNNGEGIASVAPGAMILSVKALDCRGSGFLSDVSRGIRMAADQGARVINLSLGYEIGILGTLVNGLIGQHETREFQAAIDHAAARGALVVAAAGNDALQSSYAGMENVLVAGASGPNDEHPTYSSSGAEVMAPGGNSTGGCEGRTDRCIVTTDNGGGYAAVEGTSFAAPHVSGLAALLFRQGHGAGGARSVIWSTADAVPAGPRVNAARAVGAPAAPAGGGVPGPGVPVQASGDGAGSPSDGPGGASPAETKAAAGARATSAPATGGSAAAPGVEGAPGAAQPAGTLVLGAPQNPPPDGPSSSAVGAGSSGSGAGSRATRQDGEATDGGSGLARPVSIAAGLAAAAVAATVLLARRRRSA